MLKDYYGFSYIKSVVIGVGAVQDGPGPGAVAISRQAATGPGLSIFSLLFSPAPRGRHNINRKARQGRANARPGRVFNKPRCPRINSPPPVATI